VTKRAIKYSFIIIGKNEEKFISTCITSVLKTIEYNNLVESEILYVDSKSTDKTISIVRKFSSIKIYRIESRSNAAVGRNIGANESEGGILFFIDADMELNPTFIKYIFNQSNQLAYPFVSGQMENYYYDNNGNYLGSGGLYFENRTDEVSYKVGGIFAINRELWHVVGGMRSKFRRNQDYDFSFRLAKLGYHLQRKKQMAAIHHTVSYRDNYRMWKMLFSGTELYRVVLFRDHIGFTVAVVDYFRTNYSSFLLFVCLVIFIFLCQYQVFSLYVAVILIRSWKNMNNRWKDIIFRVLYLFIRDILNNIALVFFWPKNITKIKYNKI